MEALGFGTILVLVIVVMYFGLLRPVETAAEMANDEVSVLHAERKAQNIGRLNAIEIDTDKVATAKANIDALRSIKF
jgi:preprotein translocase subunit YajC